MINSIIFSEQIDAFQPYSDHAYSEVYTVNGVEYGVTHDGKIIKINGGAYDASKSSYIRIISNDNYELTKTFDNVELHYDFNNDTNVESAWFSNTKQVSVEATHSDFDVREGTHRLSIPRASLLRFADRMRDKFIICNLRIKPKSDGNGFFSLPYIKVKFRNSYI